MAQDQNSKMAHFVTQKNGQPAQNVKKAQGHGSLNDLKVPVNHGKMAAASNTPATRGPGRRRTRSTTVKDEQFADGTDFSAVDRSSTTSGTKRAHSHGDQVQTNVQDQAAQMFESDQMVDHPESEAGNEAEVQHDNSSDGMPNDPYRQRQQAQQQNGNTQSAHERAPMHPSRNAFADQHIQGDSYPPTTSGNPSVADQRDGPPPYSTQPAETHPVKGNGGLTTRGGTGTRLTANTSARPSHQQNPNAQTNPAARNPAMPYGLPNFTHVMDDIKGGFSFGAAPNMKSGGQQAPTLAQPPQHGFPPQTRQPPTTIAHRGSPPGTYLSSRQDGRQKLAQNDVQPVAAEPQERQRQLKKPPLRPSNHPQPLPAAEQASFQNSRPAAVQRHEFTSRTEEIDGSPMVDNRKYPNYRQSSYDEEPAEEEHDEEPVDEADDEPDLYDYEVDEIYQMNFTELQKESFDIDPQADEFQLPEGRQQSNLQDTLHGVLELAGGIQSGFFKSLPAEQWEEAGDWFLDQFGDVLKKFKAARQAKRKAAVEFEDEIEKRHEAVSKKRKLTEDALGEMRKTGAVVLQGTPKKSKKTK